MNIGQAKTKTLALIREYSNNGKLISEAKNADYLLSMPHFFDTAQKEIAQVVKIESYHDITPTESDTYVSYDMPSDFYALQKVVRISTEPPYYCDYIRHRWEQDRLLIPGDEAGTIRVLYYKYPETIDSTTDDSAEFEVYREAQELIPYLAGSLAIADENVSLSDALKNNYMTKLSNLTEKPQIGQFTGVIDVYGGML